MFVRLRALRTSLSPTEQFVVVVVGLFPVAWMPIFLYEATPRVGLALALVPLGALLLVRWCFERDAASIVLAVFLAWAFSSSVLSPAPQNSLVGSVEGWSGWVGILAAACSWACGRSLGPGARRLLLPLLTIGALWNGAIALAQVVLRVDSGNLATYPGRGMGTLANPVYYGTLMAGIAAAWVVRGGRGWRTVLLIGTLAFAVGLSGGRAAPAAVVAVALGAIGLRPDRRVTIRNAAAVIAGLTASMVLVAVRSVAPGALSRTSSGEGLGLRLDIWRIGARALGKRPVFGWGPSNFELAFERNLDVGYVRQHLQPDDTIVRWIDAHNVVVNLAVGTGVVGMTIAIAFVVLGSRKIVEPALLVGAAAIVANWMLEPSTVHSVPIALLLFGAAAPATARAEAGLPDRWPAAREPARRRELATVWSGIVLCGCLLASMMMTDVALRRNNQEFAEAITRYGYRDAYVLDAVTVSYVVKPDDAGLPAGEALQRAEHLADRAAELYPVTASFARLGEIAFLQGDYARAKEIEYEALRLQRLSPLPNRRLVFLAEQAGDDEARERAMRVLCAIGASGCEETGGS